MLTLFRNNPQINKREKISSRTHIQIVKRSICFVIELTFKDVNGTSKTPSIYI